MPSIILSEQLAPGEPWGLERCPIAGALDEVGARSAFLILREASYGYTRFADLASRANISEPVASARLKELVDKRLLVRRPYREPGSRTRDEYLLTDKGAELLPVLVALLEWGNRWVTASGPQVHCAHHECGSHASVELRCDKGHAVAPGQLELVPGSA